MKESLLGQVERSPVLSDWGDPDRSLLDLFRRAFGAARRLPAELIRRVAGRMGSLAATAGLAALLGSSLALGGEPVSPGTGKGAGDPVSGKPNIVFILADDLGYGDLGCYGQKEIQTPRLDRMSAEGVRFTQFYSSAPVCAPARRSLLTGLHGGHSTCRANLPQADMQLEEVTVAEVLKGAGYATAITGKWAEGVEKSSGAPNRQGFDHFFGIEQSRGHGYYHWFLRRNDAKVLYKDNANKRELHCTNLFTDEAIGFIRNNKDKPFFLYLSYQAPHFNYEVPDEELKPYADKPWDAKKKAFAALVTMMDRNVGRVLDALKEQGLDEKTVVMFSSDNGPSFTTDYKFWNSCGGLTGIKRSLNEGGIREPMIVRWPGKVKPGSVCDAPFAGYDFMATAAELAGTKPPEKTDGVSFLPSLLGKEQKPHDYLYWETHEQGKIQAVRMGNWKLLRSKALAKWGPQLYDLEKDPGEKHSLAKSNPEILEKMLAIMRKEHTPSPVQAWQLPAEWLVPASEAAKDSPRN